MTTKIVPENVRLAAKRGFVRTSTQALAAAIPTAGVTFALTQDWAVTASVAVLGNVVGALLAGAASYLNITSKGIPEDYQA